MQLIKKIFKNFIEDILIFLGLFIIIYTTFKLNRYAGLYTLGFTATLLGIYLAYYPPKIK